MKKFLVGIFLILFSIFCINSSVISAENPAVSYPEDVDTQDIAEDEYTEDIDVEQMYRRMLFNYLTDNKDDHCKNFSFYVVKESGTDRWRWRLAPAYDLTLSLEGYNGEHATSVNGTGLPRLSDIIAVGTNIKMSEARCRQIIDEVRYGSKELIRYKI